MAQKRAKFQQVVHHARAERSARQNGAERSRARRGGGTVQPDDRRRGRVVVHVRARIRVDAAAGVLHHNLRLDDPVNLRRRARTRTRSVAFADVEVPIDTPAGGSTVPGADSSSTVTSPRSQSIPPAGGSTVPGADSSSTVTSPRSQSIPPAGGHRFPRRRVAPDAEPTLVRARSLVAPHAEPTLVRARLLVAPHAEPTLVRARLRVVRGLGIVIRER